MDTGTLFLLGTGLKAGAGIGAGYAAMAEGRTAERARDYEAAGYDRQASEEVAAAQRVAFDRRKKTDRVISEQVARGAASGSALSSPGLLDIIGDTAQYGEYLAESDMYGGLERGRVLRDKAAISRLEGDAARTRGRNAFAGSILSSLSGLATGVSEHDRNYGRARPRLGATGPGGWRTTVSYG